MAFSERSYLGGSGRRVLQGVKWLLIANTAIYVLYFLAVRFGYGSLFSPFVLNPAAVLGSFAVWQLATYLFLHDPFGFWHVLFNMLALWMFGSDLENAWGTRRFLRFYFLCGIGAGLCVVLASILFDGGGPTIGASGAVYGLLLAYGMMYPDREILFSFLFPIKAKYFVMIIGGIALLSSLAAPGGPVSHLAHLGGMVFGYFLLRSERTRSPYARRSQTTLWGDLQNHYKEWKLQRARRKFQVYMKKHQDHDRDRTIH